MTEKEQEKLIKIFLTLNVLMDKLLLLAKAEDSPKICSIKSKLVLLRHKYINNFKRVEQSGDK